MGSGARRSGRIDGEGRRGRSLEMMTMAAARGPSGRVRRRGGRGRHCGALGGVGEARGGWWPRRTASVATAVFGFGRERKSRGAGPRGRVRGVRGGGVASPGVEEGGTQAGGGQGGSRRWPRPLGRAPRLASVRPPGRGGRGQGGGGGLGRLGRLVAPGRLRVSGPGRFSALFYFFPSVLFYLIYFATVLNLK